MGQPNDSQLLRKLTSATLAARNPEWGWRTNGEHTLQTKYSPIVMSLVKDGTCTMTREITSSKTSYNVIRHTKPINAPNGVPCPACGNLVKKPPELSMEGHRPDCRFMNYYSLNGATCG